jgi:hypothetical protein
VQSPLLMRAVLMDDPSGWVELAHALDDLTRSHGGRENLIDAICKADWQSTRIDGGTR